jgi:hypothetical protein
MSSVRHSPEQSADQIHASHPSVDDRMPRSFRCFSLPSLGRPQRRLDMHSRFDRYNPDDNMSLRNGTRSHHDENLAANATYHSSRTMRGHNSYQPSYGPPRRTRMDPSRFPGHQVESDADMRDSMSSIRARNEFKHGDETRIKLEPPSKTTNTHLNQVYGPQQYLAQVTSNDQRFIDRQRELANPSLRQNVELGDRTRNDINRSQYSPPGSRPSRAAQSTNDTDQRTTATSIVKSENRDGIEEGEITEPHKKVTSKKRARLCDPQPLSSSTPPSSTGSSPSPEPDDPEEQTEKCKCPIGFSCPRKLDNQVDCRTLVVYEDKWIWTQQAEAATR